MLGIGHVPALPVAAVDTWACTGLAASTAGPRFAGPVRPAGTAADLAGITGHAAVSAVCLILMDFDTPVIAARFRNGAYFTGRAAVLIDIPGNTPAATAKWSGRIPGTAGAGTPVPAAPAVPDVLPGISTFSFAAGQCGIAAYPAAAAVVLIRIEIDTDAVTVRIPSCALRYTIPVHACSPATGKPGTAGVAAAPAIGIVILQVYALSVAAGLF